MKMLKSFIIGLIVVIPCIASAAITGQIRGVIVAQNTSDTTPDAFSFTDTTGATTSTEYTSSAVQITGINAASAVTSSGGTVAICTGTTVGTCGSFSTSPGNITNNQYVMARITSSSSASTAVNDVVTIGGVSDTYTVTTAAAGQAAAYFGMQTTAGASSDDNGSGQVLIYYKTLSSALQTTYTCPGTGTRTLDKAEFYGYGDGSTPLASLALYTQDGNTLVCSGSVSLTAYESTPSWKVTSSVTGTCTCTGGTVYKPALLTPSGTSTVHWSYQTGSSGESAYVTNQGTFPATLPAGTEVNENKLIRWHVTAQ
jgi:hypothetical protein